MRMQTLNNRTVASDPGRIRLSHAKLKEFHPELYEYSGIFKLFKKFSPARQFALTRKEEHLLYGDSRAAVVMSMNPLLVAAYTDELDYSAVLQFPLLLSQKYNLDVGSRLLTINIYRYGKSPVADLENGAAANHRYRNFTPLIAEFLSEDLEHISQRKMQIEETEWARAIEAARDYITKNKGRYRSGSPMQSDRPAR